MQHTYRKHPRVFDKKLAADHHHEEKSLTMGAGAALGILALAFAKGLFWGYVLKKAMD